MKRSLGFQLRGKRYNLKVEEEMIGNFQFWIFIFFISLSLLLNGLEQMWITEKMKKKKINERNKKGLNISRRLFLFPKVTHN